MKFKLIIEDVDSMEGICYHVDSWRKLAEKTLELSEDHNDYARFLPACNGWNLDYPTEGDTVDEYMAALIDMAIGLQLIG